MILSLIAFSLSFGILKPGGPVKISPLPADDNPTWLLVFVVESSVCFFWPIVSMSRRHILESPPSRPCGLRVLLLVDSVIVLAMVLTIIVSATNTLACSSSNHYQANTARDMFASSC